MITTGSHHPHPLVLRVVPHLEASKRTLCGSAISELRHVNLRQRCYIRALLSAVRVHNGEGFSGLLGYAMRKEPSRWESAVAPFAFVGFGLSLGSLGWASRRRFLSPWLLDANSACHALSTRSTSDTSFTLRCDDQTAHRVAATESGEPEGTS